MFLYADQGLNRPVYDDVRKLRALADDLEGISNGVLPTTKFLSSAPSIGLYQFWTRPHLCLKGHVHGHPDISGSGSITSDLWVFAPELGWARTYSRYYRLAAPDDGPDELMRSVLQALPRYPWTTE